MGTLKIKVGTQYVPIPRGPKGETGPANVLTKGTVTTGAPGTAADVTITGASPNQTIDFTIPQGATGATGPAGSVVSTANSTSEYKTVVERRTLSTTTNTTVALGSLTTNESAVTIRLELSAQSQAPVVATSRLYDLAINYTTSGNWFIIPETSRAGLYSSTFQFQLEGRIAGNIVDLRVRTTTGGATPTLTAVIHFTGENLTWAPSTTVTGGAAAVTQHIPTTTTGHSGVAIRSEATKSPTVGTFAVIDCMEAMTHKLVLTQNTTVSLSGVDTATNRVVSISLIIIQDATGGRTVTWPSGTKWPNGTPPTLTTTANAISIVTLMTYDGGTTWLGFLAGTGMA
jgi:hypothetical protein